jgi:hypothetical protein
MMNRSLESASRCHVVAKVDPRKTGGTPIEALPIACDRWPAYTPKSRQYITENVSATSIWEEAAG